jgi:hypothetical protein
LFSGRPGDPTVNTIVNPDSLLGQCGYFQSFLPPPSTFKNRSLSSLEKFQWTNFNKQFAPYVIGDKAGEKADVDLLPIANLNWCALYPLAIYFMADLPTAIVPGEETVAPKGIEWAEWRDLLSEFWRARNRRLKSFRLFLQDWGLNEALGLSKIEDSDEHDAPWNEDRKVLGMHLFQNRVEIKDYVTRWKTNPYIRDTHLWQHKITVSRTIDLICSEILANGFEHSGDPPADVFIMAKLCSHQSAWKALDLQKNISYLSEIELKYFQLAEQYRCPILQLCIGDTGRGFGGNDLLRRQFLAANPGHNGKVAETDLIAFALSGKITTKTREHHQAFWKTQLADLDGDIPAVHGLSEVRRCIQREHGYWRIHSNSAALEYDFFRLENDDNDSTSGKREKSVRPINGCLHYFMLPLFPEEQRPRPRTWFSRSTGRKLKLLDIADFALRADPGKTRIKPPTEWVGIVCNKIVKARDEHSDPLLINLRVFDELGKDDLETACLDLMHCLFHVRDDLGVFLFGANENIQSQLRRYTTCKNFNIEYRVLPFFDFSEQGITLELGCSAKVASVKTTLLNLLNGEATAQVLKGDVNQQWDLYRSICEQNLALFRIRPESKDEAFYARLQFNLGPEAQDLVLGGCTFTELAPLLLRHQAIAPFLQQGYFRLGELLRTYLHLGRLWADPEFQSIATNWLRIAIHRAEVAVPREGNLAVIAVLHPAIELAHELIRTAPFINTEIVEIHKVSDMRWDFEPLLRLRSHQVAILIDMNLTGRTASRIAAVAEHLGFKPWACFSLISMKERTLNVREYTFCECSKAELENVSKKKASLL